LERDATSFEPGGNSESLVFLETEIVFISEPVVFFIVIGTVTLHNREIVIACFAKQRIKRK